jgi:hypothetical protein
MNSFKTLQCGTYATVGTAARILPASSGRVWVIAPLNEEIERYEVRRTRWPRDRVDYAYQIPWNPSIKSECESAATFRFLTIASN